MEKAEKVLNYTAEATAEVVSTYVTADNKDEAVKFLAAKFGKNTRSIVAKLSREGVYVSKEKIKGNTRVKKAELVAGIATAIGANEEVLDSLEKANASALKLILDFVK